MGKPKGKTSKIKIGNKSSNKRNKGSGTNKGIEKFQSAKLKAGKTKVPPKGATKNGKNLTAKIDYSRRYKHQQDEEEVDADDMSMSDDDMKTYLTNNAKNISFLTKDLRYVILTIFFGFVKYFFITDDIRGHFFRRYFCDWWCGRGKGGKNNNLSTFFRQTIFSTFSGKKVASNCKQTKCQRYKVFNDIYHL